MHVLKKSHPGSLRCCIDKIRYENEDGFKATPNFLYFYFHPITSQSDNELNRIVKIRIFFENENRHAFDMGNMESILCQFQQLEELQLDNLDIAYSKSNRFDLPKLREKLLKRQMPTSKGPPIIVHNYESEEDEEDEEEEGEEEEQEKSLDGVKPGLCCVKEKNDDWASPELCCVQIRHLIGMYNDISRSEPCGVDIVHHYFS